MALPAFVVGVASILALVFNRKLEERAAQEIGKLAAQSALDKLGIPLDLDGEVNHETITQAINAGVLKGEVTFTNLFDKDAVKADVRRIALERAGAAFGYEGGLSVDAVSLRLVAEIIQEVRADIAAGAGPYIDAAQDLQGVLSKLKPRHDDWATPKNFTQKGINNRARQAAYRAAHSRKWL